MFGIARTTATSPPSQLDNWVEVMPAATEIATGRVAWATGVSSPQTVRMTCGLTASSHTDAPSTASAAVA